MVRVERVFVAVAFCLVGTAALAASDEDIARAEREFELCEIARDVFERAENRARDAVLASSAGSKLRDDVAKALDECMAAASELTEAAKDRRKSFDERRALLAESRRTLLSCPDLVSEMSTRNDDLIAKLRDQFIAEELESLHAALEEKDYAILESAVREYSI